MNTRDLTEEQIHDLGIEALLIKLGPAGTIRFLHQYDTGKGNYSVDRHQRLTIPDVETLANQIQQARELESPARLYFEPVQNVHRAAQELQRLQDACLH